MARYKVETVATLVFEVDAPNAEAAKGAIYNAFKGSLATDALQGMRFTFAATERECSNPRLMTTSILPDEDRNSMQAQVI